MPNFSQRVLFQKIDNYFRRIGRAPISQEGHCNGLSLLWLYRMALHQENEFYKTIKDFVTLDLPALKQQEKKLDTFIGHVAWLQNSSFFIPAIQQMDVDKLLELGPKESISAVFTQQDLFKTLETIIEPDKLINVTGLGHCVAIYRRENDIFFYDPNYKTGEAKCYQRVVDLQQELIKALFTDVKKMRNQFAIAFAILNSPYNTTAPLSQSKRDFLNKLLTCSHWKAIRHEPNFLYNALHMAVVNKDLSTVNALVNRSLLINKKNNNEETPLFLAAYFGCDSIAATLLLHGAEINICNDDGESPLHVASQFAHVGVMNLLLQTPGIDIHQQTNWGNSPLHYAVIHQKHDAMHLLLRNGANPFYPPNDDKHTPFDVLLKNEDYLGMLISLSNSSGSALPPDLWTTLLDVEDELRSTYQTATNLFSTEELSQLNKHFAMLRERKPCVARFLFFNEPIESNVESATDQRHLCIIL